MRVNEPITDHEFEIPDGEPLVSRTDRGGRIVFANHVFVESSGFSEQELVGEPHNIVRHPQMPKEAFANLWATIKAGRPWDGLVKNRRKNGDFYWVRANVTPVVENGQVSGFISIRSKPTREQRGRADGAYAAIRAGNAKGIGLVDGELVRTGTMAWLGGWVHSVLGRLLAVTVAALLAILLVGWLGFSGMANSNEALRQVYDRDLVSVNQLRTIVDRVRDSRNHIAQMAIALGRGTPAEQVLNEREPPVRANFSQVDTLLRDYLAGELAADQRALADRFDKQYIALKHDIVDPAFALAHRSDLGALNALFEKQAPPLFQAVFDTNRELVDRQIATGHAAYASATAAFRSNLIMGVVLAVAGMAAVVALGWTLLAAIRRCAHELEGHFTGIIRGDLTAEIARPAAREFHHVTAMLRAMRAHLAYASWERAEFVRKAAIVRRETVDQMAQTIEQEAGAAVEKVAEHTTAMARDADAMAASAERVSANAEHVSGAADQAMKNAQVVASASEQLAAAIHEVSSQVEHASSVARGAAAKGAEAQQTIGSLSEAAGRIGAVVRLIADIAAKTNLLALNATIEAARAGEAGKGFAVVAGEVKALASQTAKATEEISQQISGLRGATDAAVGAVADIGHILDEVAQVAVSVAAAIEEQNSATKEIARNVAESGAAIQEVTCRIADVSGEARTTGEQAAQLRVVSGTLAGDITQLRGALVKTVRTATTEADRCSEARTALDEPCSLTFDGDATRFAARIRDLSHQGGAVALSDGAQASGSAGTIALERQGGARSRFAVRERDHEGRLHVQFSAPDAEFERALQSLLPAQREALRA
ncbi:MAG TPA: methyl-accepting chemotaxis protein [Acetobacteraceae bacterium]|nr:methyl-accepting chemotaxis protein [Acetobacteraceae bacterium]